MMMTAQLLAAYDDKAGAQTGSPVPIAALLAHLLFLREVGGLAEPTALSDTFGTEAFVEVRLSLPALAQCVVPSFTPGVLACPNFDPCQSKPCSMSYILCMGGCRCNSQGLQ